MQCSVFSSVCSQNASTFEAFLAFLHPCPRAGKPGWTKQKLNWGYIFPLGMVYRDTWAYSHLSQLNIHPHLPSVPFPFLSHAHPHGVWSLLSTWLTISVMDCHLPGLWVCSPHLHSSSTVALSGTISCHCLVYAQQRALHQSHCYGYRYPVGSGTNRSPKWRYHCSICIKTPYLLWNSRVLQNHSHKFLSLPLQICIDGTLGLDLHFLGLDS